MKGGKMILKKIGVLSLAKIQAILMAIFGFIMILFSGIVFSLFGGQMAAYYDTAGIAMPPFQWISLILTPAIYAIIGFISGAVIALLYNLVAKKFGGIKLDFGK